VRSLEIDVNASWVQNGVTIAGGNGKGNDLNQFSNPWGLCDRLLESLYFGMDV
jgi:hypothetical protein